MQIDKEQLKSLLVEPGFVSQENFDEAIVEAGEDQGKIVEYLIDKGVIKDEEWGQLLATHLGYLFVNLRKEKISKELLKKVPEMVARHHQIIIFSEEQGKIKIAMANPEDLAIVHYLEKLFKKELIIYLATANDIRQALSEYRQNLDTAISELISGYEQGIDQTKKDKIGIDLVNTIIEYGYYNFASDIHIEPLEEKIKVRFRIDGVMHKQAELAKNFLSIIITRLKILSKLRIDEHQKAQDGKFRFEVDDEAIDVRLSVLPIAEGENAVLRLLVSQSKQLSLSSIGLGETELGQIKDLIKHPHGMALVVGPTGSGKTTTLYEVIKELNSDAVHIASIEDPIEYNLEGVSQIQVNKKANLDFASGLRAIVRQDPDIIMVGEIRDEETVNIAINSAMTGHFVISTLHANNAATALPRLIDMGIEPYLIVSTVKLILSQRLVRRLCERCRYSYTLSPAEIEIMSKNQTAHDYLKKTLQKDWSNLILFKSEGCKVCANSGYKGRIGLFETLLFTDKIKKLVLNQASGPELQELAKQENNMKLMLEDGIDKALAGITSIDEVMRVAGANK
jgi:type IV pilus assembly protein PilB